jgi:hypothetical protein
MLVPALGLFAVAAVFGIYMATRVFAGALPPVIAAGLHGLFAATGLGLLLYSAVVSSQPQLVLISAGLLVVAALGGFVMAGFHFQKKVPPKPLVVIHAGAAVAGVVCLGLPALGLA